MALVAADLKIKFNQVTPCGNCMILRRFLVLFVAPIKSIPLHIRGDAICNGNGSFHSPECVYLHLIHVHIYARTFCVRMRANTKKIECVTNENDCSKQLYPVF